MFIEEYHKALKRDFDLCSDKGRAQDSFLCSFYRGEYEENYRLKLRLWKWELQSITTETAIASYGEELKKYAEELDSKQEKKKDELLNLLEAMDKDSLHKAMGIAIDIENSRHKTVTMDNPYILLRQTYLDYKLGDKNIEEVLKIAKTKTTNIYTDKSGEVMYKISGKYKLSDKTADILTQTTQRKLSARELDVMVEELLDAYLIVKAREELYNMGCNPDKKGKSGRKRDASLQMLSQFVDSKGIHFDGFNQTMNKDNRVDVKSKEFISKSKAIYRKLLENQKEDVVLPLYVDGMLGVGLYIVGRRKISTHKIESMDKNRPCYFCCIRQSFNQSDGNVFGTEVAKVSSDIEKVIDYFAYMVEFNKRQYKAANGILDQMTEGDYGQFFQEKVRDEERVTLLDIL